MRMIIFQYRSLSLTFLFCFIHVYVIYRHRRCQQNECFQKIVQIYETEPIDMKQLIGLMQEVQEYGQPPTDIIQAIAPGIELDDNGIPTMNPTTSTAFQPFGTNKDDDCRIM